MKKFFSMFFIFTVFIIANVISYASENTANNSSDYARITDINYKAIVVDEPNCKGKIIVTERLTFDIHAESMDNLFWELWRDLPESNVDGLDVTYKVNSVKQILDYNEEIVYKESPKLYWYDNDYIDSESGLRSL